MTELLLLAVALLVVAVAFLAWFVVALYVLVGWLNEWAHETTERVEALLDLTAGHGGFNWPLRPPRGWK